MKKVTLMSFLIPAFCLAGTVNPKPQPIQQPGVQQQEGLPTRTLIIRVKVQGQGQNLMESEAVAIPVNCEKLVSNAQQASECNMKIQGAETIALSEQGSEQEVPTEVQNYFSMQELVASEPLGTTQVDESTDAPRGWRNWGRGGFYGHGYRGHFGYRSPWYHNRARYGYYFNRLFYPYTYSNYYYPYGGYNYYYYYNPYYRWH